MRARCRVLGLVIVAAVPLLAAEFWEKKPFLEWNRNEVRRMLTRSPWARQVTTSFAPADRVSSPDVVPMPQAGGFPGANPGSPSDGGVGPPQSPGGEPFGAELHRMVVRWESALPIRQALVRSSVSSEVSTEAGLSDAARSFLDPQTEYYIVKVSGLPPSAVEPTVGSSRMARAAALKRKGQADLRPENVEVEAASAHFDVSFYFCRSNEIVLADREVEFRLELPTVQIFRKFRLKEMVFDGKLEL